jgi:hypothetical protein
MEGQPTEEELVITIMESIVKPPRGRLEPVFVRYRRLGAPIVKRFEPIHAYLPAAKPLRPQVAGLYGTNASPRDRMRHDSRWRERKMPIVRYTAIDPRWR